MSSLVEINDSQSERLQRIAAEKGVRPNELLEEALELLFLQADREKVNEEEQAFLRQLEAEGHGLPRVRTRPPFDKDAVTNTHSVPIDAEALCR